MTFISVAYIVVALLLALPRRSLKWTSSKLVRWRSWVLTHVDSIICSVRSLFQVKFTASPSTPRLSHAQFGLALTGPLLLGTEYAVHCWLSVFLTISESQRVWVSVEIGREGGFISFLWETPFWLNAQLRQCVIGIVKTCFRLCLGMGNEREDCIQMRENNS